MRIKIWQWNVLTGAYANLNGYDPEYYDAEVFNLDERQRKILAEVERRMIAGSVIVLHEVDADLRSALAVLADRRGYSMRDPPHGNKWNWFMGSVVMWHNGTWRLNDVQQIVMGPHIENNIPNPNMPTEGVLSWVQDKLAALGRLVTWRRAPPDLYRKACQRWNTAITVTLSHRHIPVDKNPPTFAVVAYHMPCAFRTPKIMHLHTAALIDIAQNFTMPTFVCMDGNFTPKDACYVGWTESGFISANVLANGSEPNYTTRSVSTRNGKFSDTLDYIWVRLPDGRSMETLKVQVNMPEMDGQYLPNMENPSDHLWMEMQANITFGDLNSTI